MFPFVSYIVTLQVRDQHYHKQRCLFLILSAVISSASNPCPRIAWRAGMLRHVGVASAHSACPLYGGHLKKYWSWTGTVSGKVWLEQQREKTESLALQRWEWVKVPQNLVDVPHIKALRFSSLVIPCRVSCWRTLKPNSCWLLTRIKACGQDLISLDRPSLLSQHSSESFGSESLWHVWQWPGEQKTWLIIPKSCD